MANHDRNLVFHLLVFLKGLANYFFLNNAIEKQKFNLARDVETKDTKYEEVLFMNPITLKPKTSIYGLL